MAPVYTECKIANVNQNDETLAYTAVCTPLLLNVGRGVGVSEFYTKNST